MNLFKHLESWRTATTKPKAPARAADWKGRGLPTLQQRLRALGDDDNLVPLLVQLLEEFGANDLEAGLGPGLSDAEAHRFRGRLGLCVELREELQGLWNQSRQPKEGK